ncbi:MAG: RNA polymerase sigma factor RpoD, partial [Burkholderiales bacterium PBB4]
MPAQKSAKPVQPSKSTTKAIPVPASKPPVPKSKAVQLQEAADALLAAGAAAKKKPGRPPKAATADASPVAKVPAKRGRKPKAAADAPADDMDMSDIEADLAGEPEATTATATGEKVKPLRMKISKAKERALMKEFGLDETVLSEEDMAKRRQRLKALITLGKTRGYLTHGEISDHLPDKLVDAETLEVVISMLNDMGVAVYEQTPDAETLLLNNNVSTAATVEEAEEEAEAALSTVDSEFGRTTDPVRMYMREMGTVELLTREGEIEI